jgi:hypothetical protein
VKFELSQWCDAVPYWVSSFVCFNWSYCLHLQGTASPWRSRHYDHAKCQKLVMQHHIILLNVTVLHCTVVNVCYSDSRCLVVLCKVCQVLGGAWICLVQLTVVCSASDQCQRVAVKKYWKWNRFKQVNGPEYSSVMRHAAGLLYCKSQVIQNKLQNKTL